MNLSTKIFYCGLPFHVTTYYTTTTTISPSTMKEVLWMLTTWVLCVRQTRCLSIKIYVYGIKIHSYLRYIFCSPAFITYSRSWIEKRVPALHFQRRDAMRMFVCLLFTCINCKSRLCAMLTRVLFETSSLVWNTNKL